MQSTPVIRKKRRTHFQRSRTVIGGLCLLPTLILTCLFILAPTVYVFILSLNKWNGVRNIPMEFVGLDNFLVMPGIEGFWEMTRFTLFFAVVVTFGTNLIALFVAFALDNKGRLRMNRTLVRAAWFMPCLLGGAVVGILWSIMYNFQFGVINNVLNSLGIKSINWLGSYSIASWSVSVAQIWVSIGLCIIVFLAGLQSIPPDLYDAAAIDGASKRQQRIQITLPMIAPAMTINVITTSITAFKSYELPWTVSSGLPGFSTRLLTRMIYQYAFRSHDYGKGAALSVILIIVITIISIIQLVIMRRREEVY